MHSSRIWATALLLSGFFISVVANAQSPVEDEIPSLPTTLSAEQLQSLQPLNVVSISEAPQPHPRRRLPRPEPQLSPDEATYKLVVQKLGVHEHRFVQCKLKDHSVVTGAIIAIGPEDFRVRPGMLREDRVIPYGELGAPPRPTAAVGTHLKNGLEMTAMVAVCVALLPMCIAATGQ